MLKKLKIILGQIRYHILTLYYLAKNPALPWLNKFIALFTVYYFLSPIDLIPDFIPFFGQLDDLIIVPLGILLIYKLTSVDLIKKAQLQATDSKLTLSPKFVFVLFVVGVWILLGYFLLKCLYDIRN